MHKGAGTPTECVQRCVHLHVIMSVCLNSMRAGMTNDALHTLLPLWIHCSVCVYVCSWLYSNYCLTEEPGPEKRPDVGGSQCLNNA